MKSDTLEELRLQIGGFQTLRDNIAKIGIKPFENEYRSKAKSLALQLKEFDAKGYLNLNDSDRTLLQHILGG